MQGHHRCWVTEHSVVAIARTGARAMCRVDRGSVDYKKSGVSPHRRHCCSSSRLSTKQTSQCKPLGAFLVSLAVAGNLAAALPAVGQPETLSIRAAHNKDFKPNGPLALAKAYAKYNKPLPSNLASIVDNFFKDIGLEKRDGGQGSDPNSPAGGNDLEYLAEVDIGTPAQKLYLDFDTGSSDLWVISDETTSAGSAPKYSPGKSSSAKQLSSATWTIQYGDGSSCSGDVYNDKVTIGGLTVDSQAVESAKTISQQFQQSPPNFSGLLGLAFDQINTVKPEKQKTWFSNIKGSLKAPLFTANLKHNADGTYNFGYIDDKEHSGDIAYTPVDSSQGFWGFEAKGYAIGDGDLSGSSINGIADTGTTLLLLDDDVVDAYYKQVDGAQNDQQQGGYVFDCSAKLPDFSFGVGSSKITVPGSLINFAPADSGSGSSSGGGGEKDKRASGSCFGGLQSNGGIGQSIFGDVALKAALVVFDAGNNQLGWAPKSS